MNVDTSRWSGDGDFTQALVSVLGQIEEIQALRVEDAPASRNDAMFMFLSNELYVSFARRERLERRRWLGIVPIRRRVLEPLLTLEELAGRLAAHGDIGEPDYTDEGMLQYLRTQRIIPPYQTRGYKLVELVRIYLVH